MQRPRFQRNGAVTASLVAVVLAGAFSWVQADRAIKAERRAAEESKRADGELRKAQSMQSLYLAEHASQQRANGDVGTALLLALAALPDPAAGITRPYAPEAELQLNSAIRTLRELLIVDSHKGWVLNAAFSPDGKRFVTASADDDTARLWNAETGKPVGDPLKGHRGLVWSAAFRPDGMRIVTASSDQTARLWDGETGKPIGEPLSGHSDGVTSAKFSPDGKRIITASEDGTARLWDGETGKPIGEPLQGHEGPLRGAAFSPDGTRIVTASDD
jgi:Tol biopolymer transport system component